MLEQWYQTNKNQSLLYAPTPAREQYRGQCAQAACFWAVANNWAVLWVEYACQWWDSEAYVQLPLQDAQPGDLIVWAGTLPNSGRAGHIAIFHHFVDAYKTTFVSIDQNWNGKYIHYVQHDRSYVLGAIRGRQVGGKGADEAITQGANDMADKTALTKLWAAGTNSYPAPDSFLNYWDGKPLADALTWLMEQDAYRAVHQKAGDYDNLRKQLDDTVNIAEDRLKSLRIQASQLQQAADQLNRLAENEALAKQQRADAQAQASACIAALNNTQTQINENSGLLKRIAAWIGLK